MEWLVYCKHEHVDHISPLKSQICGSALFAVQLCFQIQLQIQNKYKYIDIVKVRIEISANRYISSAVQMSDVLSHKSMLLGGNFSPSEMELALPHILLTLFALFTLLTLLTSFKMHVRTAPTANTAYLEACMHIKVNYILLCGENAWV